MVVGPPKTAAGHRVVSLPPAIVRELETHLDTFTGPDPDAWLFTGPDGRPLMRHDFARVFRAAADSVKDLPEGFRFHDLRGTGATLAAQGGATFEGADEPARARVDGYRVGVPARDR